MGIVRNLTGGALSSAGKKLVPRHAAGFVRGTLDRSIDGVGSLLGAARQADKTLASNDGDVEAAVRDLIEVHTKYAGVQGFVTNIGGLVTAAATIPANIAGLALVQCHLVAGIAHLRGYDLDDPRVRDAVLVCMLGRSTIDGLIKDGTLPGTPRHIATMTREGTGGDPTTDDKVARLITAEIIAGVGGKRMATFVGKRIPFVGGAIGGASDGWSTWQLGRYAAKELIAIAPPGAVTIDSPTSPQV